MPEAEMGGTVWGDHAPHRTGIRWGAIRIAGDYRGMVFQGEKQAYPPGQVEIMSESRNALRSNVRRPW